MMLRQEQPKRFRRQSEWIWCSVFCLKKYALQISSRNKWNTVLTTLGESFCSKIRIVFHRKSFPTIVANSFDNTSRNILAQCLQNIQVLNVSENSYRWTRRL